MDSESGGAKTTDTFTRDHNHTIPALLGQWRDYHTVRRLVRTTGHRRVAGRHNLAISLLRRLRQLSDQPERDRELVQLEMGLEKAYGAIAAWLAWDVGNLDAGFLQRVLGL